MTSSSPHHVHGHDGKQRHQPRNEEDQRPGVVVVNDKVFLHKNDTPNFGEALE